MPSQRFADTIFWNDYGLTPDYSERIKIIQLMVFSVEAKTVLDIECGKGEVINSLTNNTCDLCVFGADPFREALVSVNVPCVRASLPHIPFDDNSFDLVLCLQVLEHLSQESFYASLREIERLSRRYIIIGVPFKENLKTMQVICAKCQKQSHAFGHVRSFYRKDLINLFPGYILKQTLLAGVLQRRKTRISLWIEHRLGAVYHVPQDFVCPRCGSNKVRVLNRFVLLRKFSGKISDLLTKLKPCEPYWIISLYEKSSRWPS